MRGDLDGAIDDYSATLAVRPDYAEAYNNRATARVARDDFEGAAADLARALSIVPPDWRGRAQLAANLAIVEEAIRTRGGRLPAADQPAPAGPPP